MRVGDVLHEALGFETLCPLPEEVAWTWVINVAPNAPLLKGGATPQERPMKDWVNGWLVVVAVTDGRIIGILKTPEGHTLKMK